MIHNFSQERKFSIVEDESDTIMVEELTLFAWHLSWRFDNPNNPMMGADEIHGELLEEVAKGLKAYATLPFAQKKLVIKRMMDNRIAELRHKYYATHRKASKFTLSIETYEEDSEFEEGGLGTEEATAEPLLESSERVAATRARLSPGSRKIFDSVLYDNTGRLASVLLLAMVRATAIMKTPGVNLKPWHVADAIGEPESKVRKAFVEIKRVYKEVCNEQY